MVNGAILNIENIEAANHPAKGDTVVFSYWENGSFPDLSRTYQSF
jgi:hypothetical protein